MIATERHISRPFNSLLFGPIGGFAGTILMDLDMILTFVVAGASPDLFFSMLGEEFGED